MIANQVLQVSIDELKAITKIDFCIMDIEGIVVATTFDAVGISNDMIQPFANSLAESQVIQGYHLLKIYDDDHLEYILIAKGSNEDAYIMGRVAVCQIQNLIIAYRERFDKNNFFQNLILDNLLLVDIYNRAKKLHIAIEALRVVYIIETKNEKDNLALETVKGLYGAKAGHFITAVDERNIILVKELRDTETYEDLENTAKVLVDMLNSEAMSKVRVAYGTIVKEIKEISKSYKEAKMALDVGNIFYSEKNTIAYSSLGIGRLIYQLPINLCEIFVKEIFGDNIPDNLDEETLVTVNRFFENNLNVSETSRQLYVHRNTLVYRLEKLQKACGLDVRIFDDALTFKIALMVINYMKYIKTTEF